MDQFFSDPDSGKRVQCGGKVLFETSQVQNKGYVIVVDVDSLTRCFLVPMGWDIIMVYNITASGLNTSLWAPHFALPTVGSTLCVV